MLVCAQALALDTIGKVVKLAGPQSVRPHLPALATALLESLSGLEARPAWLLQGSGLADPGARKCMHLSALAAVLLESTGGLKVHGTFFVHESWIRGLRLCG